MRVATQTDYFARAFGERKAVEKLGEIGFDALDFSMFEVIRQQEHPINQNSYEAYARELRHIAGESGTCFNQAHAPFPTLLKDDHEYNRNFPAIKRSIEFAGMLGADQIVVHPVSFPGTTDEILRFNLELFESLVPLLRQFQIKVALENMFWHDCASGANRAGACGVGETFIAMYDMLDSRYFTCCLDVGHCGLVGETAQKMIMELGQKRLGALHVHDNDFAMDRHTMPFLCKLDWDSITKALSDIGYRGDFTFEADNIYSGFPTELYEDIARLMLKVGRHLTEMIEAHSNKAPQ